MLSDAECSRFAIRIASADELFYEFDARPVAERPLLQEVHDHLLDGWERVRADRPDTLLVYLPETERDDIDEAGIRAAIQSDMQAACGPLRHAGPLSRRERLAMWLGIILLVACISISTLIDRLSDAPVIEGVAQGIVVVGWVALWQPAAHFATEVVPHFFNRRRYREFAGVDVDFVWT